MATGRASTRPWVPYTAAIAAGVVVIAAAYLVVRPAADVDCTPLQVSASVEKDVLLGELTERYNDSDRRYGDRCATVTVRGLTSGAATDALAGDWAANQPGVPRPQVWLPSSSLWSRSPGAPPAADTPVLDAMELSHLRHHARESLTTSAP